MEAEKLREAVAKALAYDGGTYDRSARVALRAIVDELGLDWPMVGMEETRAQRAIKTLLEASREGS